MSETPSQQPVALVTGGSRGIGRGICLELARHGYAVAVNYAGNEEAARETQRRLGPESLPVLTLANAERFLQSRDDAVRVVERLLEYLVDLERHRGTGRLYLP